MSVEGRLNTGPSPNGRDPDQCTCTSTKPCDDHEHRERAPVPSAKPVILELVAEVIAALDAGCEAFVGGEYRSHYQGRTGEGGRRSGDTDPTGSLVVAKANETSRGHLVAAEIALRSMIGQARGFRDNARRAEGSLASSRATLRPVEAKVKHWGLRELRERERASLEAVRREGREARRR